MNEQDYLRAVDAMIKSVEDYISLPNPDNYVRMQRELLSIKSVQYAAKHDGIVPTKQFIPV